MTDLEPRPVTERDRLRMVRQKRGAGISWMAHVLSMTPEDYREWESSDMPIPEDNFPELSAGLAIANYYLHYLVGQPPPGGTLADLQNQSFKGLLERITPLDRPDSDI